MITADSVGDYVAALASRSATPGGGAAAGVTGAQAAALMSMVYRSTRDAEKIMPGLVEMTDDAHRMFLQLAEEDMAAFTAVMAAFREPPRSRHASLQPALIRAAEVPLAMITLAGSLVDFVEKLAKDGNPNLITDVGIAAMLLETTISASRLNVLVNLKGITDRDWVAATMARLDHFRTRQDNLRSIGETIDAGLAP